MKRPVLLRALLGAVVVLVLVAAVEEWLHVSRVEQEVRANLDGVGAGGGGGGGGSSHIHLPSSSSPTPASTAAAAAHRIPIAVTDAHVHGHDRSHTHGHRQHRPLQHGVRRGSGLSLDSLWGEGLFFCFFSHGTRSSTLIALQPTRSSSLWPLRHSPCIMSLPA